MNGKSSVAADSAQRGTVTGCKPSCVKADVKCARERGSNVPGGPVIGHLSEK